MELIQRVIKRALTTGTTESCTGTCRVIIPDLAAVYYFKLLLSGPKHDFGFFDPYYESEEEVEGITGGGEEEPPPPESFAPAVNTGTYTIPDGTFFKTINESIIVADGYESVTEYGVLFTDDSNYNTASTLIYENASTYVTRSSTTFTPSGIPFTFTRKIIPPQDTTIYYRAFAINSIGIGYGLIKSAFTGLYIT